MKPYGANKNSELGTRIDYVSVWQGWREGQKEAHNLVRELNNIGVGGRAGGAIPRGGSGGAFGSSTWG